MGRPINENTKLSYAEWVSLHHDAILPQEVDILNLYAVKNSFGERGMTLRDFEDHFHKALEGKTVSIKPATVPPCIVYFLIGLFVLGVLFVLFGSLFFAARMV